MTTLRIVELEGGKYSVQMQCLFCWGFVSGTSTSLYVWRKPVDIHHFCVLDSLAEAETRLTSLCEVLKMRKMRIPRVTRVVKKVRV